MRETTEPTVDQHGDDVHPSYARVTVTRGQGTPRALFDSETLHSHTVTIGICEASRKRDLNRDWVHAGRLVAEIEMSESQWASLVASVGQGGGVSATMRYARSGPLEAVPDAPFSPRLALTANETRDAARRASEAVREAFARYKEHKTVANLRHLEAMINNIPANLKFAADSLTEHTEAVVAKAHADIEAAAMAAANRWKVDVRELEGYVATTPQIEGARDE